MYDDRQGSRLWRYEERLEVEEMLFFSTMKKTPQT